MSGEAPALTLEELTHKLGEIFKPEREDDRWRRKLAALYGRCDRQVVEFAGQRVQVIPVSSEFELREAIPDPHEDENLAFVLGYPAIEVPIDLAGRFHKRGRVVRIGKFERLRRLFSGRQEGSKDSLIELDRELVDSALARYLLELGDQQGMRSSSARIGLEQAHVRWLQTTWGVPERLSLDNLLVFAATNGGHAAFGEAMRRVEAAGVEAELLAVLSRMLGPEAALIWRCWLADKGQTLLEFAVLFEAHAAEPNEGLASALLTGARYELVGDDEELHRVMPSLAGVVATALELFVVQRGAGELRQLLARAEERVHKSQRVHLRGSRRLPCAWTLRLEAVGVSLAQLASDPTEARYAELSQRVRELELHDALGLDEGRASYAQAEMARRLAAYLVVRSDRRWAPTRGALGKFEALAGWYAQEGGYVDLARRRARAASAGESEFAKGVRAVLAQVDALRVEQDREFAGALPKWIESDRAGRRTVAIDKAIDRFGAAFLRREGGAKRRLLVLVMDGMAWSQAVELLAELGSDNTASPWHPLGWNREVAEIDPRGSFIPVLASCPTDTDVSRSALFSGEPTPAGVAPRTTDDGQRWAKHSSIAALFPGVRKPSLLAGNEAFDAHGLTGAARTAIADDAQPAVAVLLNTIDNALKADGHDAAPWTVQRIAPLRELFDAARDAGRFVLMCSDHGNVSGQRLSYVGFGAGGAARWRTARAGDKISEFEVLLPSPPGWRPPETSATGVILIADDAHAYSGQRKYGEHGGASLAEVVTPTVLLGTPEFARTDLGDDLGLVPISPPAWWLDEVREGEGRRAAVEAEAERALAKHAPAEPAPKEAQLPLIGVVAKPPEVESEIQARAKAEAEARVAEAEAKLRAKGKKWVNVTSTTDQLLDKLENNPLFKARTEGGGAGKPDLHNEVIAALAYLLERQDKANGEAFAVVMGKHKRAAAGLVSTLSAVLNVDGYEVLVYDAQAKMVRLERELLIQGFGL